MSDDDDGRLTSGKQPRRPRVVLVWALLVVVAWLAVGGFGGPLAGRLSEVQ
jgi:RND superfamily putative drug exporter